MKKRILFFAVFVMFTFSLYAQSEDPSSPSSLLGRVLKQLEDGKCEDAQRIYNAYLVDGEPKPDVKAAIDKCIEEKEEAKPTQPKTPPTVSYQVNTDHSENTYNHGGTGKHKIDWTGNSFCRDGKNRFIAWNIVGGGYPWNLVTGLESRAGGIIGYGFYGDIGIDYTSIAVKDSSPDGWEKAHVNKFSFRYAAGIKFYPYNGLFIDFGYGTIAPVSAEVNYPFYIFLDSDDEKVICDRVPTTHGFLFHAGYNYVPDFSCGEKLFFGVSFGASYDVINEAFAPSVNLKLGVAWEWHK